MLAPGPLVRSMFGPLEPRVSEAYRRIFIDLDYFTRLIAEWCPAPARILEVGCGEGAMTERLARIYPQAEITAIDISPRLGRLYRGNSDRVSFRQTTIQEIAAEPGKFDLAVLSDVMHHVPMPMRPAILRSIRSALNPSGSLIFKDWTRSATPIYVLTFLLERYITGDRVRYYSRPEIITAAEEVFGPIVRQATVPPWKSNIALHLRNR
jgi:2-polyprenyl-3-methyl-5-hydroxy-6-metoxy-1,4-benzoquinol methylase